MNERSIYFNFDSTRHPGLVDSSGKEWDVPGRIQGVIKELSNYDSENTNWVDIRNANDSTLVLLETIHSKQMIDSIRSASACYRSDKIQRTIFDRDIASGSSAIYAGTYDQALISIECSIKAAQALKDREAQTAISLSRPPGHHAGKEFYHGFCYFNNVAAAAEVLKANGKKVVIIDIDVHHGDGTQDIFYEDPDVLYISLHGSPSQIFPGTGYSHEIGMGKGLGATLNLPFDIGIETNEYLELIKIAKDNILNFKPDYLIVSAGFDAHKDEFKDISPITMLDNEAYRKIGKELGGLIIPKLVVFEGGYNQSVTPKAFKSYLSGMDCL